MKRWLFVGLGGVGQRHLRNLRTLLGDGVDVLAYRVRRERDLIGDKLHVVAGMDVETAYGVRVFDDLEAALAERPEAAVIANPTSLHVEIAQRVAEAGCHLFLEKPLSHDLTGVEQLIHTVKVQRKVGAVAYQLRFHPGFACLRRWLAEQRVGTVWSVSAEVGEYLPGFHPYEDYRRMYASRRDLGGGVTLTQIHEIDLLMALFGMPERVFSLGGRVGELEIDVEDMAVSLLEYRRADGGLLPVHLHQDYLARPARRGLSISGSAGRIDWRLDSQTLRWTDASGEVREEHRYDDLERNQLFLQELSQFIDCVERGGVPEVSLRAGADSLRIALALRESQVSGRPVVVTRPWVAPASDARRLESVA